VLLNTKRKYLLRQAKPVRIYETLFSASLFTCLAFTLNGFKLKPKPFAAKLKHDHTTNMGIIFYNYNNRQA
jgi:hypothetical protein